MELSEDNQRNIVIAEQLNEEGTRLFWERSYADALAKHARVFLYISGLVSRLSNLAKFNRGNVMDAETEARVKELKQDTLLNQAMCLIKMNEPARAIVKCDKAMEIERTARVLFLRGQALLKGGNFHKAKLDLQEGKCLEPENPAFDHMLAKLEREEERKLASELDGMAV